jgi:hypothetical protein
MKNLCLLSLISLTAILPLVVDGATQHSTLQLTVELTDGSRIIGTTTLSTLPVRSEMLGKLDIPLAKIRAVKFSRDHESVEITMTNDDNLKASLGELTVKLQTVFGKVTVPLEHVTGIGVSESPAHRTRFSTAADFSAENNPNGPWSYGWRATDAEEMHLFRDKLINEPVSGLYGWGHNNTGPCILFNTSAAVLKPPTLTWKPKQLTFHPGPGGEYCIIRWTAPRSGRCQIAGAFTGVSSAPPTTTDVHVFHNGKSVYDSFINLRNCGNESSFDIQQDVKDGDTIDFVVGYGNGNYGWDTTGLDAVITYSTQSAEK